MWFQLNWPAFYCGFTKNVNALDFNEINHLPAFSNDNSGFSAPNKREKRKKKKSRKKSGKKSN